MNQFDWSKSFLVDFDLKTGFSQKAKSTTRHLSQVQHMFLDGEAAAGMLKDGDPLIYEFYELGCPEEPGELAFGSSIIYPGQVGDEYYMTKGHFHTILETAEVYYTLSGEGYMVMENPEGDTREEYLTPGQAIYVPKRYAHRSVNTGSQPLVLFFTFDGNAGHDYKTIETQGFRKLMVNRGGKPTVVDNPRWAQ